MENRHLLSEAIFLPYSIWILFSKYCSVENGKSPLWRFSIFLPYSIWILFPKYYSMQKWKIATVGRAIFLPYSNRILFSNYCSVEKRKIATVGGAIFLRYSIRVFLFFRSTENGGKPWWIFTPPQIRTFFQWSIFECLFLISLKQKNIVLTLFNTKNTHYHIV